MRTGLVELNRTQLIDEIVKTLRDRSDKMTIGSDAAVMHAEGILVVRLGWRGWIGIEAGLVLKEEKQQKSP